MLKFEWYVEKSGHNEGLSVMRPTLYNAALLITREIHHDFAL